MNYSEFQRESLVRHQSEKLLDQNLIRFERKQVLENYEKEIEKKVKRDQEALKQKEEEAARLKGLNIKPHEALEKILKHFDNPKKCPKAIVLFKDLIIKNFDNLEPDHIFYGLYELIENFKFLPSAEDKKNIYEIFTFIDDKKEAILKNDDFKEIYRIWCFEGLVHTQLFTDDSFQFTSTVKKVNELVAELMKEYEAGDQELDEPPQQEIKVVSENKSTLDSIRNKLQKNPTESPNQIQEKPNVSLIRSKLTKKKEEVPEPIPEETVKRQKYEYTIPEDCLIDIKKKKSRKELKQSILFEMTKDLYGMYKYLWAKPTIKQYFDQLYLQRDIFNEEQKKAVEDLKAGLSNLKGADLVKGFRTQDLDSKIMSNPLNSRNEVKDARATSFSFDGLSKWSGRQSGL